MYSPRAMALNDLKPNFVERTPRNAPNIFAKSPSYSIGKAQRRLNEYNSPLIPVPLQKFDVAPLTHKSTLEPPRNAINMKK